MEDPSNWFRYSWRFQGKDENKLETFNFSCFLRRWGYGFVWKGGRGIYNWKWYSANWETNSQQKPANKCNYKSFLLLIAASVPSVEKPNKLEKEFSNFFCRFFPNYFRKIVGHWRGKTYTGHSEQMHCLHYCPICSYDHLNAEVRFFLKIFTQPHGGNLCLLLTVGLDNVGHCKVSALLGNWWSSYNKSRR